MIFILGVKLVQFLVVAFGESTLGGHIHDEQHFALVLVQFHVLVVDVLDSEIVYTCGFLPLFIFWVSLIVIGFEKM